MQEPLNAGRELVQALFLSLLIRHANSHGHLVPSDNAVVQQCLGLSLDQFGLCSLFGAFGHALGESLQLKLRYTNALDQPLVSSISQSTLIKGANIHAERSVGAPWLP